MKYREEDIVRLFKNFRARESAANILEKKDVEAEFLKRCLDFLEVGEGDILLKTFSDGVSIRQYSRYSGLSRFLISKHREKSVKTITKLFNLKFCD